jgi:hypothetical protein
MTQRRSPRPGQRRLLLAILTVLSLEVETAFAQGKPSGNDPGTAPQAFPNEPYHTGTVFSEIFCHHPKSSSATPPKGG